MSPQNFSKDGNGLNGNENGNGDNYADSLSSGSMHSRIPFTVQVPFKIERFF